MKFVVRAHSGFRVHYACIDADVTIWLPIGADVVLEKPTYEWEGKIKALVPRTFRRKDTSLQVGCLLRPNVT